jgi:hypothetical protein
MSYIQVKAMAGVNYVRANDILAVQFTDRDKCTIMLTGGVLMPCYEPAAVVVARIEEQMKGAQAPAEAAPDGKEPRDGDGSA